VRLLDAGKPERLLGAMSKRAAHLLLERLEDVGAQLTVVAAQHSQPPRQ
jgi:hypothetical protein